MHTSGAEHESAVEVPPRQGIRTLGAVIESGDTRVLPLEFQIAYPVAVRGDGAWVEDADGRRYLDAMSGGSMAATLGHGRRDIAAAATAQAARLSYVHSERLTSPAQEQLARELVEVAPEGLRPRSVRHQRLRRERDGDPDGPRATTPSAASRSGRR